MLANLACFYNLQILDLDTNMMQLLELNLVQKLLIYKIKL